MISRKRPAAHTSSSSPEEQREEDNADGRSALLLVQPRLFGMRFTARVPASTKHTFVSEVAKLRERIQSESWQEEARGDTLRLRIRDAVDQISRSCQSRVDSVGGSSETFRMRPTICGKQFKIKVAMCDRLAFQGAVAELRERTRAERWAEHDDPIALHGRIRNHWSSRPLPGTNLELPTLGLIASTRCARPGSVCAFVGRVTRAQLARWIGRKQCSALVGKKA